MNNLTSEKPIEVRKLIDVAYLVLVLAAFAWAKEFLLPLILAILISCLLAPVVLAWNSGIFHIATPGNPRVTPSCSS
jgi:predicted PurR-regulated permease PerM